MMTSSFQFEFHVNSLNSTPTLPFLISSFFFLYVFFNAEDVTRLMVVTFVFDPNQINLFLCSVFIKFRIYDWVLSGANQ